MKYAEGSHGRVFVLRLGEGDRIPDSLEQFAEMKNISSAICFAVGGAKEKSKVVVGPKDGEVLPPEPMHVLLNGVHEMCGVGTLFRDESGQPKLHMHASFGRGNSTITGCVRLGVDVWHIEEIIILEILGVDARRAKDAVTNFEFLEIS